MDENKRFLGITQKEIVNLFSMLNKILSKEERNLLNKFHGALYGLSVSVDDALVFATTIDDARKRSQQLKDFICCIPWLESTKEYDQEIEFHRKEKKKLIPFSQWEKYRYDFTKGQIKGYILKRKENGLEKHTLMISNRLYIDSDGFDEWVNSHREVKEYPKHEKPIGLPQQPRRMRKI